MALELTGLSSENAELAYRIFDLVATAKVIKLALSKGSYQMLQVTVSSGVVPDKTAQSKNQPTAYYCGGGVEGS